VKQREDIAKADCGTADARVCDREHSSSRREFLTRIPGAAAVGFASTAIPVGSAAEADAGRGSISEGPGTDRARDTYETREEAAREESKVPVPRHITNGDEQNYPNFIGNFSKGLPHNSLGEVDRAAYFAFLDAARQGTATAFEKIPLGGNVKLVNPLAGVAFDLEGTDSHQLAVPAFPSVTSRELADQAVELYWMALCRDVNFTDYGSNPRTQAAAAELSSLPAFSGPRSGRFVTSQTLFRGFTAGDVIGPYVSQLLLCPFSYGPYAMSGKMSMYVPGLDYMTSQGAWLTVQNDRGLSRRTRSTLCRATSAMAVTLRCSFIVTRSAACSCRSTTPGWFLLKMAHQPIREARIGATRRRTLSELLACRSSSA
jgi:hypothetical protein